MTEVKFKYKRHSAYHTKGEAKYAGVRFEMVTGKPTNIEYGVHLGQPCWWLFVSTGQRLFDPQRNLPIEFSENSNEVLNG